MMSCHRSVLGGGGTRQQAVTERVHQSAGQERQTRGAAPPPSGAAPELSHKLRASAAPRITDDSISGLRERVPLDAAPPAGVIHDWSQHRGQLPVRGGETCAVSPSSLHWVSPARSISAAAQPPRPRLPISR